MAQQIAKDIGETEIVLLPLPAEGTRKLTATPERGFDLGAGKGRPLEAEVRELRQELEQRRRGREFRMRRASFKGKGLQPGARPLSWDQLRDLAYSGRGS